MRGAQSLSSPWPSASLHRFLVRNEQDFFPGQRVISKQILSPVSDVAAGRAAVGVVKSLSYKDQTVCVSWIPEESGEEVAVDRVDTVMMSTYDLARSLDHNFFYGAIVVRLRPTAASSAVEETVVNWVTEEQQAGHQ